MQRTFGRTISARAVVKAAGAGAAVAGGGAVTYEVANFIYQAGPVVLTLSIAFVTVLGIVLYKATGNPSSE